VSQQRLNFMVDMKQVVKIVLFFGLMIFCPVAVVAQGIFDPVSEEFFADADLPPLQGGESYLLLNPESTKSLLTAPGARGEKPSVTLKLPNGETIRLKTKSISSSEEDGTIDKWIGTVEDTPFSRAIILGNPDGSLSGDITIGSREYEINSFDPTASSGELLHVLREKTLDLNRLTPSVFGEPLKLEGDPPQESETPGVAEDYAPDHIWRIDLLTVFTKGAREYFTRRPIETEIRIAVDKINLSFEEQFIPIHINLVHSEEIEFPEGPIIRHPLPNSHLDILLNDGTVEKLRAEHAADLVSAWVGPPRGNLCGQAKLLEIEDLSTARSLVSIVSAVCATKYHSFAHEIAHNLGAGHEQSGSARGRYPHSRAFVKQTHRTTAATSNNCNNCPRLIVWSDPNFQQGGFKWGEVGASNNRSTFIETAPFVSSVSELLAAQIAEGPKNSELGQLVASLDTAPTSSENHQIDVLFLAEEPSPALTASIRNEVSVTNLAFEKSKIAARIRSVGIAPIVLPDFVPAPDESGADRHKIVLDALRVSDKSFSAVYAMRKQVGADIVIPVLASGPIPVCGHSTIYEGTPNTGFSTLSERCFPLGNSLAHAIGHNLGARHEFEIDPTVVPFPNAHGWSDQASGTYTIMAYGQRCSGCRQVGLYSGIATGTQGTRADNASVLNQTAPVVSQYSNVLESN